MIRNRISILLTAMFAVGLTACPPPTMTDGGTDTGTADVPRTDASDVPSTDVPPSDVPAVDVPVADVPIADVPVADVPPTDVPVADGATSTMFIANLSGAQEVPPVRTVASGTVQFTLNAARDTLMYNMTQTIVGASAAHIHLGGGGTNGAVVFTFTPVGTDVSGMFTLTPAQAADLEAGRYYVNVHTAANPGGELRGQILRPGETLYTASLSRAQEVPPNPFVAAETDGASLIINAAGTSAHYRVTTTVAATAAHIHLAPAGTNGAVVYPLTPAGMTMEGDQAITATDRANLDSGMWYVNVHSAAFANGEVRGQLLVPGSTLFLARLDGIQEVPAVSTMASGSAAVILNYARDNLRYNVTTAMITPTAAHIHRGMAGEAGAVAIPLTPTGATINGTAAITAADATLLVAGRTYVNVHTAAHASGEIRGQLLLPGEQLFVGVPSGSQENPPVITTATGIAALMLSFDRASVRYNANTSITPTAAHFHEAMGGVNGGVVVGVTTAGMVMDGSGMITAANATSIEEGLFYFNIHTTANPGGELRGQMLRPGELLYVAALNGGQEIPAVSTSSTGNGTAILNAARDSIRYRLQHTATATAAHIHGAAGGNAGLVIFTVGSTATATGNIAVTAAQVTELQRGRYYFNVHTAANPSGEIRGQILRSGEVLYTALLSGLNEIPPVVTSASGGLGVILNAARNLLTYDGTLTALVPTAMHFHLGGPLTNGAVQYTIVPAGSLMPSGTQAISAADLANINGTGWYVNVHTTANPGGEIRGQLTRR